jgi:hypothetical protein
MKRLYEASAIGMNGLKFGIYKYSLLGTAPASNVLNSGASITYHIPITPGAQIVGQYITKNTIASTTGSVAKVPIFGLAANSITVSTSLYIFGADVMEGVVITLEP